MLKWSSSYICLYFFHISVPSCKPAAPDQRSRCMFVQDKDPLINPQNLEKQRRQPAVNSTLPVVFTAVRNPLHSSVITPLTYGVPQLIDTSLGLFIPTHPWTQQPRPSDNRPWAILSESSLHLIIRYQHSVQSNKVMAALKAPVESAFLCRNRGVCFGWWLGTFSFAAAEYLHSAAACRRAEVRTAESSSARKTLHFSTPTVWAEPASSIKHEHVSSFTVTATYMTAVYHL